MHSLLRLQNSWKILERKRRKVFFFQFVLWFFLRFKAVRLREFFFVIVVQFFSNYNSSTDVVYFSTKFSPGRLSTSILLAPQTYFFLAHVFMSRVGYWVKEAPRPLRCCWNKIVPGPRMSRAAYHNLPFEHNVLSDVFNPRRRLHLMTKTMNILSLFTWSLEKTHSSATSSKHETRHIRHAVMQSHEIQ